MLRNVLKQFNLIYFCAFNLAAITIEPYWVCRFVLTSNSNTKCRHQQLCHTIQKLLFFFRVCWIYTLFRDDFFLNLNMHKIGLIPKWWVCHVQWKPDPKEKRSTLGTFGKGLPKVACNAPMTHLNPCPALAIVLVVLPHILVVAEFINPPARHIVRTRFLNFVGVKHPPPV